MVRLLAWGMLVVVADPRLNNFDVLPDVVGWAMVLVALLDLRALHRDLRRAALAAAVGLVVSAVQLALFFSEEPLPVLLAWTQVLAGTAWWLTAWWVLLGLADVGLSGRDPSQVDRALAGRRLAVVAVAIGAVEVAARVVTALVTSGTRHVVVVDGLVGSAARVVVLATAAACCLQVFAHARSHTVERVP